MLLTAVDVSIIPDCEDLPTICRVTLEMISARVSLNFKAMKWTMCLIDVNIQCFLVHEHLQTCGALIRMGSLVMGLKRDNVGEIPAAQLAYCKMTIVIVIVVAGQSAAHSVWIIDVFSIR